MELVAAGFQLVVAPDAWLIHRSHPPSASVETFRQQHAYRACLQELKEAFQADLQRKYGMSL
jgi:glycosyltransferase-like protein LARGE